MASIPVAEELLDVLTELNVQTPNDCGGPFWISVEDSEDRSLAHRFHVFPTDTLATVDTMAREAVGKFFYHELWLETASGKKLSREHTLLQCGLGPDAVLVLLVDTDVFDPSARGAIVDWRQWCSKALVLWTWDGTVYGTSHRGLKLPAIGETVYIDRVVDKNWYYGHLESKNFRDPPESGIFPDVHLQQAYITESQPAEHAGPASAEGCIGRPPLPPPPPPPVAGHDIFYKGTRVRLSLQLDSDSNTLKISLSLISAPGCRISNATLRLCFYHGTIEEMVPGGTVRDSETETSHVKCSENTISGDVTAPSSLPVPVPSFGVSTSHTHRREFIRSTCTTITGDGVGSENAYWVMKEDPGPAGRGGLDSHITMSIRLSLRPEIVRYEVTTTLVKGRDGVEAGFLNSRQITSGIREVNLSSSSELSS